MTQWFDPLDPTTEGELPACDAFEVAIGMRARGALPPRADAQLAAHLPSCVACRSFADQLTRIEAALTTHATVQDNEVPDWQTLRDRLSSAIASYQRWMPLALAGGIVGGLVLYGGLHALLVPTQLQRPLSRALVYFVPFAAAIYLLGVSRGRRLLAQTDVVAAYREALASSVRAHRFLRWWCLATALLCVALGLGELPEVLAGSPQARFSLVWKLTSAVIQIGCALLSRAALHRARHKLAELR